MPLRDVAYLHQLRDLDAAALAGTDLPDDVAGAPHRQRRCAGLPCTTNSEATFACFPSWENTGELDMGPVGNTCGGGEGKQPGGVMKLSLVMKLPHGRAPAEVVRSPAPRPGAPV